MGSQGILKAIYVLFAAVILCLFALPSTAVEDLDFDDIDILYNSEEPVSFGCHEARDGTTVVTNFCKVLCYKITLKNPNYSACCFHSPEDKEGLYPKVCHCCFDKVCPKTPCDTGCHIVEMTVNRNCNSDTPSNETTTDSYTNKVRSQTENRQKSVDSNEVITIIA